jgi:acyl-CoA synthetase (AMP-forming)/AMP-acid ligase II
MQPGDEGVLSSLLATKELPPNREALVIADRHHTWAQLRESVASIAEGHQRLARRRVALRFSPTVPSYALLFALEALQADLFLLDSRLPLEEARKLARDFRLAALLTPTPGQTSRGFAVEEFSEPANWSGTASVTILTSGTAGKPKAARHTWQSLGRPARRREESCAPRWLQTYKPNLYAGLQVLLQCFVNYGTLYVPGEGWEPSEIARWVAENRIEYISATPSYWRRLLLFSEPTALKAMNPVQITLGGEVIDQAILDSLKRHFPQTRIVHIYATTELGRCFSVTDGLQGFPKKLLDNPSADGVEMRIRNGELFVRSANAMAGYDPYSCQTSLEGDWVATGDLVTVAGNRVVFTGRKTDMINVGGNKVHPIEVEQVIRSVPGVCDVRVFGKRSSISGMLVACEIVSDQTQGHPELQESVRRICQARLAAFQRPCLIEIVNRIELSGAQKTIRNEVR